ncbi:hypothetical protein PFISCL1PPCAC_833, partial [Pristionchus fissidentatus]
MGLEDGKEKHNSDLLRSWCSRDGAAGAVARSTYPNRSGRGPANDARLIGLSLYMSRSSSNWLYRFRLRTNLMAASVSLGGMAIERPMRTARKARRDEKDTRILKGGGGAVGRGETASPR